MSELSLSSEFDGRYLLRDQPAVARVPLAAGEVCEAWFSHYRLDLHGVVLLLGVEPQCGDAHDETELQMVRFPWSLLGHPDMVANALHDATRAAARSEPWVDIVAPNVWTVHTRLGVDFSVANYGYSVEDGWLTFSVIGHRRGAHPESQDVLRFPMALTRPEDSFWFPAQGILPSTDEALPRPVVYNTLTGECDDFKFVRPPG